MKLPNITIASNAFVDQLLPEINPTFLNADTQLLININRLWSADPLSLRTNIPRMSNWQTPYPHHIIKPYVFANSCNNLESIGHSRAKELLNKNKRIIFFWSGGIDSTFALSFLLNNLTDPAQLTIYHTCDIEHENPEYIDYVKKFNVQMTSWSDAWETLFDSDVIVLTGTTADQITASIDESFYANYYEWLYKPWQEFCNYKSVPAETITKIENKLSYYEGKITSVLEARWWFYFIVRHQYWATRDWNLNLENGPGAVTCFFDTHEFDAWSQCNKNSFFKNNAWNEYKQEFKDEIYKFWPNKHFNKNKTKYNSGSTMVMWSRKKMAKFNQQYLFIYANKYGQQKSFCPRFWPYIDKNVISEDLDAISDEF